MRRKMMNILLFIAVPAILSAQPTPQIMQKLDLVTPPGSAVAGIAHVEDLKIGDRRLVHTFVTTNEDSADLTFDGRTIQFGDGYRIVRETVANTRAVRVERLTASTPDGTLETAVIVLNRESMEAAAIGADRYARLLKGSHDAQIAAQILSELNFRNTHIASGLSVKAPGAITTHGDDCLSALLAVETACMGVVLAASSGNPGAILLAFINLAIQTDKMIENCPTPTYGDGTIGWG